MDFQQSTRVGLAAALGLAVVMPILYFTEHPAGTTRDANAVSHASAIIPAEAAEAQSSESVSIASTSPQTLEYLEVLDGCTHAFGGACVNIRSGPGTEYPVVGHLRTGVVLRVADVVQGADRLWYRVTFDEWVRYPNRIAHTWYVAAEFVHKFEHREPELLDDAPPPPTTKRILVDRSDQMLYAYDGDTLFMEEHISTGNDDTPTPRGQFHIFHKTPSRYMQGPVPGISDDVFDLPGVPWTMYFTKQGGAIHGAYWHDAFGNQHSHGCVNLPPDKAKLLYEWADLGTPVTVRD